LIELILDKTSSKEYEVTYVNGAITVFGGLIHGFSYEQGRNDDLIRIKLDLSRGAPKKTVVEVQQNPNALTLSSTGPTPPPNAPTAPTGGSTGFSQISPAAGLRMN
jgi:hypothetical protein